MRVHHSLLLQHTRISFIQNAFHSKPGSNTLNTLNAINADASSPSTNSSSVDENGIVSINADAKDGGIKSSEQKQTIVSSVDNKGGVLFESTPAQQAPTSTTDNIQQAVNGSSSMPISTAVVSAIQGTSTPQGVSSVNIDANAIGQTIANSLSNIGSNIAPAHIQQAVSGSATNATTGTSGDNAISAITQGGGSMGGGHVGSMLAEGKAEASTAGAKATKISTEHASNDYMQGADVLDELKKFNESIVNDNKMKEG